MINQTEGKKEISKMVKTMMKNPKISRIVFDAIDAPIGSTKRQKAKSILSVFTKTDPNKLITKDKLRKPDGKGGLLDMVSGGQSLLGGSNLSTTTPSLSKSLFSTPTKTDYSAFTGSFSPTSDLSALSVSGATIFPPVPKINMTKSTTTAPATSLSELTANINALASSTPTLKLDTYKAPEKNNSFNVPLTQKEDPSAGSNLAMNPIFGTPDLTKLNVPELPPTKPVVDTAKKGASTTGEKPKPEVKIVETQDKTGAKTKNVEEKGEDYTYKETTKTDSTGKVTKTSEDIPKVDTGKYSVTTGGSSTTSSKTGTTGAATETTSTTKTPPSSSATDEMSRLQKLYPNVPITEPGASDSAVAAAFPGAAAGEAPTGGTLAEQRAALVDFAKKQKGVDELQKRLEEMQLEKGSFTQDATDYIRSRDVAVAHLDKMIYDAKMDKSYDPSNPMQVKLKQNYINYLLGLKQEQNRTYADYVNRSIDQFNNEMAKVETDYKSAVESANDMITRGDNILTSDYQSKMDEIAALQARIDNIPIQNANYTLAQLQIDKMRKEAVKNALGTDLTWDEYIKQRGAYAGELLTTEKTTDSEGNDVTYSDLIDPNLNLPVKLIQYTLEGGEPQNAADIAMIGINNRASMGQQPDVAFKEYFKWANQFNVVASSPEYGRNPAFSETQRKGIQDTAWNVGMTLLQKARETVSSYMLSYAKEGEKLVQDLAAKKSRDQFITDNSTLFDTRFLNSIYDNYELSLQAKPTYNILDNFNKYVFDQSKTVGRDQAVANWIASEALSPLAMRLDANTPLVAK